MLRSTAVPSAVVALAVLAAGAWLAGAWPFQTTSPSKASSRGPAEVPVELLQFEGTRWVREQRDRHRPLARALDRQERLLLEPYFPERILGSVRLRVVGQLRNPDFFAAFDRAGEPYPIDFARASGLALLDTILITEAAAQGRSRQRLLFHELVHVVQYDLLGLERYMQLYVQGWEAGGRRYREIPLERMAFELASRFGSRKGSPFRVDEEVRRALAEPH